MRHKSGRFVAQENEHPSALLVHGGAWNIPDEECEVHRKGLEAALVVGRQMLGASASALETAAAVVAAMEAHGAFDAGCGAVLTREGQVELDAGIMCGDSLRFGAVAGIRHFLHPVRIAKRVIEVGQREYCMLGGDGAEQFAVAQGFNRIPNEALICDREQARFEALRLAAAHYHTSHPFLPSDAAPRGTVGCVVRDYAGRLAAATSTGGTPFRISGRIGDSPLPGCGYYANHAAAASATGWGEAIAAVTLCREAVYLVARGASTEEAAAEALMMMGRKIQNESGEGATGGLILIDSNGEGGWAFTTPRMARGGGRGGKIWFEV